MSKSQQNVAPADRAWNAPKLKRIGTIADVAGSPPTGSQGSGGKS